METFNHLINSSSIVDILTLRYDPSISPNLPKKSWKDFVANADTPNLNTIENMISEDIRQKIEKFKTKKYLLH